MPRVHILVLAAAVALVCFTVVAHAQLLLDPAFTFADPYIPTSSLFNYDPSTHVFDAPLPLRAPLGPLNVTFQRPEGLRWFYLYVSSLALNASLQGPLTIPLLYHWHGYGSSAGEGLAVAQAGVEAGGWALISGSGTFGPQPFQPTGRGFNAGYCCTLQAVGAPLYQPDDVTFGLTALQATRDLLKPYNISIDPDRYRAPAHPLVLLRLCGPLTPCACSPHLLRSLPPLPVRRIFSQGMSNGQRARDAERSESSRCLAPDC